MQSGALEEVEVSCVDGRLRKLFTRPDLTDGLSDLPAPTGRIRVLSPFDPMLRDRNRAERLFGFHYRIEVFVPEAKRTYGYYVFPLLEGDKLIGRIDMKAHRDEGVLRVKALWPERAIRWADARTRRLQSELDRVRRFAGLDTVEFAKGWLKEPK